ncbi:MAG TPA: TetR/AcrR family transcriptional regulator [Holophaga sp.]|nr:TetR/AcrR family transcriptional regulator [Holophaga sp.]
MKRSHNGPDTRTALLEAAVFCFAERGFDGASIRMIADRAGRPISLISHHFGGKEGLYLETFKFIINRPELAPLMGRSTAPPPRNRAEAIHQFRECIHALYTQTSDILYRFDPLADSGRTLFLRELHSPRPEIFALVQDHMRPWKDQVHACITILQPGLQEAEIAVVGASITGQAIIHGLAQILLESIWGPNSLTQFKTAEILTDLALRGLGVTLEG